MAPKRKKSKARKKKTRKQRSSSGDASAASVGAAEAKDEAAEPLSEGGAESAGPAPAGDETGDEGATPAPEAGGASAGPERAVSQQADESEPEPIVIDLSIDDDEDDEDDEALRERLIAQAAGLADEAFAEAEAEAAPASEPAPQRRPNPDVPTLTPAALAALTAIHREGMADRRGELVLDLGEATTEQERSRILAAALAHAEMQEAIYRVPGDSGAGHRWKGTIASSLFLLATLVFVLPPPVILPDPPPRLRPADHLHGVRVALVLQAQQIEAFRAREGRLPDSMDEVPTAVADVRYVKSSNRLYQLVAHTPQGETVVYDSASPTPEFGPVRDAWLPERNDS